MRVMIGFWGWGRVWIRISIIVRGRVRVGVILIFAFVIGAIVAVLSKCCTFSVVPVLTFSGIGNAFQIT